MDLPHKSTEGTRSPIAGIAAAIVFFVINSVVLCPPGWAQTWASSNALKLVLPSAANDPTKTLTILAPTLSGSLSLTLPSSNTPGALINDGNGVLSWSDIEALGVSLAPTATARNIMQPSTFSVVPLTIKGASSQASNLQDWRNSSNTLLAYIDKDGNFTTAGSIAMTGSFSISGDYKIGGNKALSIAGIQNTFIGESAGNANTSGFSNTYVGNSAGLIGSVDSENTFLGSGSGMFVTAGSENTFVGVESAFHTTTGDSNTFIGAYTATTNTTGRENTTLGATADLGSNNLTNAMALGFGATVSASNKIQLGNANVTLVNTSGAINSSTGFRVSGSATSGNYLRGDGTNFVSSAIQASDLPFTFNGFANPTASMGLTAVSGSASTAMRSDAAPALDQSIAPTWTGAHIFAPSSGTAVAMTVKGSATSGDVIDIQNNNASSTWLKVDHAGLTTLSGGLTVSAGSVTLPNTSIANSALQNSGALTVTASTGLTGGGSVALGSSTSLSLDQAVAPTWTGAHVFAPSSGTAVAMTVKGSATSGDVIDVQNSNASSTWLKVDHAGLTTLSGGLAVSAGSIALPNTSIANAALQGSGTLTVTAGTGLSGGGSVALGGSVSLSNAGVTSLAGTTNRVSVSGSTGSITLSAPQDIATSSAPTFASETLSSTTNQLTLGTTNTTTLSATAPSTSRTYTLPDAGSNATVALMTGTVNPGGVLYAASANATTTSVAGTSGQFLLSGDSTGPTWGSAMTIVAGNSNGNFTDGRNSFPMGMGAASNATLSVGGNEMLVTRAGTIKHLYVGVASTPASGKDYKFVVVINGSASTLVADITNGNTTANSGNLTDTVAAGDLISMKLTHATAAGAAVASTWAFEITYP